MTQNEEIDIQIQVLKREINELREDELNKDQLINLSNRLDEIITKWKLP